jgi:Mg2+/citrate symporter
VEYAPSGDLVAGWWALEMTFVLATKAIISLNYLELAEEGTLISRKNKRILCIVIKVEVFAVCPIRD